MERTAASVAERGALHHGSDGALPSSRGFATVAGMPGGRKHPVHQPIVERFNEPAIVILTLCTKDRKPLLTQPDVVGLLRDSWRDSTSWLVGRFVIMPDHLHLFCATAC